MSARTYTWSVRHVALAIDIETIATGTRGAIQAARQTLGTPAAFEAREAEFSVRRLGPAFPHRNGDRNLAQQTLRITFEEYAAIEAVNWTTLREMDRSPAHYKQRLEQPREDTTRLATGRAAHTAVFEPDRFPLDYAVYRGEKTRASNEYKEFAAANEGRTILKEDEYTRTIAIRDAVRSHPVAGPLLAEGEPEVSLVWTDPDTGLACKARPDWIGPGLLVDLKTTADVDTHAFGRIATRLLYHCKMAHAHNGLRVLGGGPVEAKIIAVETEPPHDVTVFAIDDDQLWNGEQTAARLLRRVAECRERGHWPGRYEAEQRLDIGEWVLEETGIEYELVGLKPAKGGS